MKNLHKRLLIIATITLAVGLTIYRSSLISVISAVLHRDGSSHGLFIPFLSAYFIWTKRDVIQKIEPAYDLLGLPLLAGGIFFPIINVGTYHLHFISFIVFVAGLVIIVLGRNYFKEIAFPILFLITMTPLTGNVYQTLADYLRHATFGGSLWIISLLGIPYYKTGWLIQLPNALLEVATGCSGIRYFISYFIFGIAYAYLFRRTTKSRITVVALTLPISLMASILRLTAIFILTYLLGPWVAGQPHIYISWTVFVIILFLSIALDQYLQKRLKERKLGSN